MIDWRRRPAGELSAAAWVRARIVTFAQDVGSLVPAWGSVLSSFTTTSEWVWFALWEGYGGLQPRPQPGRPLLDLPKRKYLVYVGPLADLPSWPWEGPNLWWPDDRAWFVASEIDLVSTYVGGSAAAMAEPLHDPPLEVVHSSISDRITADADQVYI